MVQLGPRTETSNDISSPLLGLRTLIELGLEHTTPRSSLHAPRLQSVASPQAKRHRRELTFTFSHDFEVIRLSALQA